MTALHTSTAHPVESTLLWVFSRNGLTLTCDVSVNGSHDYAVTVLPLWDTEAATVETFGRPLDALCRHAEIAELLRDAGWVVTEHGGSRLAA